MAEHEKPIPKLGMQVFCRDSKSGEIQSAIITNDYNFHIDGASERTKQERIVNLTVFLDGSGYLEARQRVKCGLGKGMWWHSLEMMQAETILERHPIKLSK